MIIVSKTQHCHYLVWRVRKIVCFRSLIVILRQLIGPERLNCASLALSLSRPLEGCSFRYLTLECTIRAKCQLPCSDKSPYYMELMRRRSFLRAFNFPMASSNGINSPFDCVSLSSRLRIFTERDSFSWAPTTKSYQLNRCYQEPYRTYQR